VGLRGGLAGPPDDVDERALRIRCQRCNGVAFATLMIERVFCTPRSWRPALWCKGPCSAMPPQTLGSRCGAQKGPCGRCPPARCILSTEAGVEGFGESAPSRTLGRAMRKMRVRMPTRAGQAQRGSRSVRVASCQEAFPPRCVRWQRRFYAAADFLNLMLLQPSLLPVRRGLLGRTTRSGAAMMSDLHRARKQVLGSPKGDVEGAAGLRPSQGGAVSSSTGVRPP
jgi:hypothetical protein